MSERKLLVTGASGKLGRQVVSYLLNELQIAPSQLIVTTRKTDSLVDLVTKGVDVREADFANPDSLEQAFCGADNLLLISIDAVGQRSKLHYNAIKAAEKVGVKHVTYTSMPSADTSPVVFAYEHVNSEKAIADSTIPTWTILRNNWYYENLYEFSASVLQSFTWLTAAAQGRSAQISRADLAYAAASSLVKGLKGKKTLTLNGPKSLTTEDMAKAIDSVLGKVINVVYLSDEDYKRHLEELQLPRGLVAMITTMDQHGRGNYSDGSSEEFEELTGKKPQTFTAWLEENRSSLLKVANQV
ncbi:MULTISPECIES: NAD(P)H-binding protein [Vibrio]|uniref:NmrA family NAD(P)-binding protein n=1 Tax=Vibrio TaxID=662 RepID=UPI00148CDF0D|nr:MULTISPECIES: NAD(P)H-binding protein [Vibrio]NOH31330.1 NAD(P)H-binding protein [Vibrio mediterranei]